MYFNISGLIKLAWNFFIAREDISKWTSTEVSLAANPSAAELIIKINRRPSAGPARV